MQDTENVHTKNVNMACDLQGFLKQTVRKVHKRARTYKKKKNLYAHFTINSLVSLLLAVHNCINSALLT